ncbi:MAG: C45 family autoproteolytic acyltransferase/hydrolase [Crocinitomicaceae bacterium]|nr:C45 family autoproteolytic acyltransferase/hydrolase [Crocinitomicaceae bacterium]
MQTIVKYILRLIFIPIELVMLFIFGLLLYVMFHATVKEPTVYDTKIGKREKIAKNYYVLGNNYLKKNEFGIWEMYIEGSPYERGLIYGELAKELNHHQEEIFVNQINEFVPKGFFQHFLNIMVGFFTNSIPEYIPLENQQEIYGISKTFSDEYDYIAPKYTRILGYHAAHDMGHALNDYSVVGCTSFALKGEKTASSNLILGRNFDFYVGDDFAKDKILLFVNPSKGYKFVTYSWAGFTGVASGMNEQGLTVTINASKSDLPTASKMPISLLAREILQYAKNVNEAIAIAKKRETFVSETLMIGSANDNKTILIEKSPKSWDVYEMKGDDLICSNHYQSKKFENDPINISNIKNSDSKYRYDRVRELIDKHTAKFTPADVAQILRNQKAANNDTLGIGNPRAINQLLAHHSVVMLPVERMFYISTNDFQLGRYMGYDLTTTFKIKDGIITDTIPADPFLNSPQYKGFLAFKDTKHAISQYLMFNKSLELSQQTIQQFIAENSESYVTYEMLGKYFMKKGDNQTAKDYFKLALTKRTASNDVSKELEELIKKCSK